MTSSLTPAGLTWRGLPFPRSLTVGAGALLPLVICSLLALIRDSVSAASAALVMVLVVVAVGATGDRVGGLVAAVSGAAWFDFFLTKPYLTFTIDDAEDIEITVMLVVIGVAVTELALWGRRQQRHASEQSGYLEGVLLTAEAVKLRDAPPDVLAGAVATQIGEVLGVECRYLPAGGHDRRYAVLEGDGRVRRGERYVDVDRDGLPVDEYTCLPIRYRGSTLGCYLASSATRHARPSLAQRRVALILADQVGTALGHAQEQ